MNKFFSCFCFSFLICSCLHSCIPTAAVIVGSSALTIKKDRQFCASISDLAIANSIRARFIKENTKDLYLKIGIEVNDARVLLTGTVPSDKIMQNAVEICNKISGVVEVINELTIDNTNSSMKPSQYSRDLLITAEVKRKLISNRKVKSLNYTIVTVNNIVYILGLARTYEELKIVTDVVSRVKGVHKVVPYIKISEHDKS